MPFEEQALPDFGGMPAGDPTIGLNSLMQNLRRNRPPPVQAPPAPAVEMPIAQAPATTQPSEFDRLLNQAVGLFKSDPEDDRLAKIEQLKKDYETLGIKQAEIVAAAKAAPGAGVPAEVEASYKGEPGASYMPPEGTLDEERYLKQTATDESSNNPLMPNQQGSGAHGLFQFMPGTWADVIKKNPDLGLTIENLYEKDPEKARDYHTRAMRAFTKGNIDQFTKTFNRKPTGGELYLMHMLGAGGGQRLVQGASKPLNEIVDAGALAGNPGLAKFKNGTEALTYYNRRFS